MLAKDRGGPLAETDAALRLNPVSHRDNDIQVVVLHLVRLPVRGSMCKKCTYYFTGQFSLAKEVADMPRNDRPFPPKKLGHLLLGQPNRFTIQGHLDRLGDIRIFVDDDFAHGWVTLSKAWARSFWGRRFMEMSWF